MKKSDLNNLKSFKWKKIRLYEKAKPNDLEIIQMKKKPKNEKSLT
jgi:hypothetical protein